MACCLEPAECGAVHTVFHAPGVLQRERLLQVVELGLRCTPARFKDGSKTWPFGLRAHEGGLDLGIGGPCACGGPEADLLLGSPLPVH